MSVAFTREEDVEAAAAHLPDRPISPHPNIVTAEGLAALDAALDLADAGLSAREREILFYYAAGQTTQSVAFQTGLSPNTIADYVSRIRAKYEKAGRLAHSRVDLYRRAEEDGIVPDIQ